VRDGEVIMPRAGTARAAVVRKVEKPFAARFEYF
jgi:hypothetical protein